MNCPGCAEDEFQCQHTSECIPLKKWRNKIPDCRDRTDEPPISVAAQRLPINNPAFYIYRLSDTSECITTRSSSCNTSTCFNTSSYVCSNHDCNVTDVICSSTCPEKLCSPIFQCADGIFKCSPIFQCADGNLIPFFQFCDGNPDCFDNSDEIRNQPGFKCKQSITECVLPQLNLRDDVAHCDNGLDLCDVEHTCFECFDGRLLISSEQVCDGVIDCYDVSDECLCNININKPICSLLFDNMNSSTHVCSLNTSTSNIVQVSVTHHPSSRYTFLNTQIAFNLEIYSNITHQQTPTSPCLTKNGSVFPTECDGRIECRDYSDECNCENSPSVCDDPCFSFYQIGDRYCDGVIDEAWKFINDSACPRGFDEEFCPDRFKCKSGNKVSIDISQICDGVADCDDQSDEQGCSKIKFSSDTEMIANSVLRSSFWIMGFLVMIGNMFVIVTTTQLLKKSRSNSLARCQRTIILNISCADFLMGIYLFTIAIFSQIFSGVYGMEDVEWRSSLRCSIIGSLAVVSSEASCFLMVTLTGFRLYTVCRPFSSVTASTSVWKMAIFCSWLMAIVIGVVPIPHRTLHYFVHTVYFPIQFNVNGFWSKINLSKFGCRFAAWKNLRNNESSWQSTRNFLESNFPDHSPLKEFGYYGETSVCMPRFYVVHGDNAWEYTLTIITINFLAFAFILFNYILVYLRSRKQTRKVQKSTKKLSKQELRMQQRIARIIITDFTCWMPICIMSYLNFSGIDIPFVVYQISAVYLLPINSALNPFLYSSIPDKLIEKLPCGKKSQNISRSTKTQATTTQSSR